MLDVHGIKHAAMCFDAAAPVARVLRTLTECDDEWQQAWSVHIDVQEGMDEHDSGEYQCDTEPTYVMQMFENRQGTFN